MTLRRALRWGAIAFVILIAAALWVSGVVALPRQTGYLAPIFAPDGQSIYVVRRDVRSLVTGFGWEFFTPPAVSRVQRDRLALINIRLADGKTTVVEEFPPSPLEGTAIRAYHGAIFGSSFAHLRWADPSHLDYEIGVTRADVPASHTFVVRRVWNAKTGSFAATGTWQESASTMGGNEPEQLHGDLEVLAPAGTEGMPCAVVLLRKGENAARPLVTTRACAAKYREGYPLSVLQPGRDDIERSALLRNTRKSLVERGRQAGLSEIDAELAAIDEMERLGLYPKSTKLVAEAAACANASPLFEISEEELTVGLFQDIERAIASPGKEINKGGQYLRYRGYDTSQRINEYIEAGHTTFFVKARGACWKLIIQR